MKITGAEFKNLIKENPSWCLDIKEPLKVTTFVSLICSNITHLSPLITFSGQENNGWAANFYGCENLEIATGKFNGVAIFRNSGIKKIENLTVTKTNEEKISATFSHCQNLKVATGTYKGFVDFESSGIETIKGLIIENTTTKKHRARFLNCPIKYIPEEYRREDFIFERVVIENSIREDIIKEAINKIKSETNNIVI